MFTRDDLISKQCDPPRVFKGFLAFESPIVEPGATITLIAVPDMPFRPLRPAFSPACAKHFQVLDFCIGNMRHGSYSRNLACSAELFLPAPFDAKPSDEDRSAFFQTMNAGVPADLFPATPMTEEQVAKIDRFLALGFPTCGVAVQARIICRNSSDKPRKLDVILWGAFALQP